MLVAGGPLDGPCPWQRLAGGEDLLDHDPAVADRFAQPVEVGLRIDQTVDVIDADAGEGGVLGQHPRHGVDDGGDLGVHDSEADEAVDREEPADVARRVAPPLQAVVLAGQRICWSERLGARRQREALRPEVELVTDHLQTPDHLVEGVAEHREDDVPVGRRPVDVEPARRLALGTVAQHRPPPRVELGLGDGGVVGHVVDQRAHAAPGQVVEQRGQPVAWPPSSSRTFVWSVTS